MAASCSATAATSTSAFRASQEIYQRAASLSISATETRRIKPTGRLTHLPFRGD